MWDRLEAAAKETNTPADVPTKPVYFRYLTLMAFHAYLQEGVDSAVIECGIGGEYDSTNILTKPTVSAVTSLGIDHTAMLGSTLPEIAWHKAGIFKEGSIAITAPQKEEAISVLKQRSEEKGLSLHVVDVHPALINNEVTLGLSADFQKTNASVAIAAAAAHLRSLGHTSIEDPVASSPIPLPEKFKTGLEKVRWPGRCETRHEAGVAWYIDGGHTLDSIEMTGSWFADQIKASKNSNTSQRRVLVFNQQTRDAKALVKALHEALVAGIGADPSTTDVANIFTHVIFCTNKTYNAGYKPDLVSINTNRAEVDELAVQKALGQAWAEIDPSASISIHSSIEDAINDARKHAQKWRNVSGQDSSTYETPVLITGSLHLVGGAIDVLENDNVNLETRRWTEPTDGMDMKRRKSTRSKEQQ